MLIGHWRTGWSVVMVAWSIQIKGISLTSFKSHKSAGICFAGLILNDNCSWGKEASFIVWLLSEVWHWIVYVHDYNNQGIVKRQMCWSCNKWGLLKIILQHPEIIYNPTKTFFIWISNELSSIFFLLMIEQIFAFLCSPINEIKL